MSLFSRLFGTAEAGTNTTPIVVDVQEASRRQLAGALLIDVRQPDEFRQGHAADAKLIPLGELASRLKTSRVTATCC